MRLDNLNEPIKLIALEPTDFDVEYKGSRSVFNEDNQHLKGFAGSTEKFLAGLTVHDFREGELLLGSKEVLRDGSWASTGEFRNRPARDRKPFELDSQFAVNEALFKLKRGRFKNFMSLVNFLAVKRRIIQYKLKVPEIEKLKEAKDEKALRSILESIDKYGRKRVQYHPAITPFDKYLDLYGKKLDEYLSDEENISETLIALPSHQALAQAIPLTVTARAECLEGPILIPVHAWQHTDPAYFEIIEKELEHLFSEYLTLTSGLAKFDEKKIAKKVGMIHWWMANAMFFMRGSAAIADYASKVLLENAGIKYGCWKENIHPDIEAFMTEQYDFPEKYANGEYFK